NSRRLRHWIGSNVCRSDLRRVDESSALTRPGRCQLPSAKPLDLSAGTHHWRTSRSARLSLRPRTRLLLGRPALAGTISSVGSESALLIFMPSASESFGLGILAICINVSLMIIKIGVGVVGNSYALVADGIESASDT